MASRLINVTHELNHGIPDTLAAADADVRNRDQTGEAWTALLKMAKSVVSASTSTTYDAEVLADVSLAVMIVVDEERVSIQHVEYFLRAHNTVVWLFAGPNVQPETTETRNPLDFGPMPHTMIVSLKGPTMALAQMIEYSGSYSENFAKLAQTGVMMPKGHADEQIKRRRAASKEEA